MRLNRYVASASGVGRRQADKLIANGQVKVDGVLAVTGQQIDPGQVVLLANRKLELPNKHLTIMLNKPAGYIVSRQGQGAPTIYQLLTKDYQTLKPIGRLDKDSSGLLLMTSDGDLINRLAHPRFKKIKIYQVVLDKEIAPNDVRQLKKGITLEDGLSKMEIRQASGQKLLVALEEGRNRQIRRSFDHPGYKVTKLHRIAFGKYALDELASGHYREINS